MKELIEVVAQIDDDLEEEGSRFYDEGPESGSRPMHPWEQEMKAIADKRKVDFLKLRNEYWEYIYDDVREYPGNYVGVHLNELVRDKSAFEAEINSFIDENPEEFGQHEMF